MGELQIFKNEEFGNIRTVTIDNEPMFCLTDVCKSLGLSQASKVKERLNEKGVNTIPTPTAGGNQNLLYINESNLYKTIFQSRKESAERFTDWVTSEVLPTLRKTGAYQMQNLSKEMKAILMHDEKIVKIENRMDKLEFEIPLYGAEADDLSRHVKRKGVSVLGGKKSEAYNDKGIRDKVYRDIYNEIKREFGVYAEDGKPVSYKALKRKYLPDAHNLIDSYEPPCVLAEQISDANAQMRFQ